MLSILMLLADSFVDAVMLSDDGKAGWDQSAGDGKGGWDEATDSGKAGW